MLKWTSVLAFVVACFVGVTAFCADDAPAKKERKPMDPGAMFDRMVGEGKTELTKTVFTESRLGKMLGEKAGAAWKTLAGDKDKLTKDEFIAAVKKSPNWLRDQMPERKPGEGRKPRGERKTAG
jgi:hypothetical protein